MALVLLSVSAVTGCGGPGSGGSVSVLGSWTGQEEAGFRAMLAGFERSTGIHVDYTGTRDADSVLASELQNGNPPDTAVLANPGEMRQYAAAGQLLPLDGVLNPRQQAADYPGSAGELTMAAGPSKARHPYGIVVKAALKSIIWYDPQRLPATIRSTLTAPGLTWQQLSASTLGLNGPGKHAWCMGLADTSNSGWPGTDWIEDFLLHQAGPQVYDQWVEQLLPWTDPRVKQAWQSFGSVVAQAGDSDSALRTGFGQAGAPMFAAAPGCFLDHEGSFIPTFYAQAHSSLRAGTDYDFVPFPKVSASGQGAEEIAGDLLGMFRDTPAARKLVAYLTTAQAQRAWIGRPASGAISINRSVPATAYPDPLSRKIADNLRSAAVVRFDASDSMPHVMSAAFSSAVLEYAASPSKLDGILAALETVRQAGG
jgi:alpha-glucoside transport system substrate-binding protein